MNFVKGEVIVINKFDKRLEGAILDLGRHAGEKINNEIYATDYNLCDDYKNDIPNKDFIKLVEVLRMTIETKEKVDIEEKEDLDNILGIF